MSMKIYLHPEAIWQFYNDNPKRMEGEIVAIAENKEMDTVIYLTDKDGFPFFIVMIGEDNVFDDYALNDNDCAEVAKELYHQFLTAKVTEIVEGLSHYASEQEYYDEVTEQELDEAMVERENELHDAAEDFFKVLMGENNFDMMMISDDNFILQVVDDICEYLYTDHAVSVHRPTYVTDPYTGSDVFEEYPYCYESRMEEEIEEELNKQTH